MDLMGPNPFSTLIIISSYLKGVCYATHTQENIDGVGRNGFETVHEPHGRAHTHAAALRGIR